MKSARFESFARAAMVGLLAAAQPACDSSTESKSDDADDQGEDGSGGSGTPADENEPATGGTASDATGGAASTTTGGAGGAVGALGGAGGLGGGAPVEGVTSSKVIADLSLEDFSEMCGEAGGVVETHAVCGGVVTGPGFSYDDDTDVFTEHTCAGYNTCSGFSCVIDE
jgi:hypothetical protein